MLIVRTSTRQYVAPDGTLTYDIGEARQFYAWSWAHRCATEALTQHPHLASATLCIRHAWEKDWWDSATVHQPD